MSNLLLIGGVRRAAKGLHRGECNCRYHALNRGVITSQITRDVPPIAPVMLPARDVVPLNAQVHSRLVLGRRHRADVPHLLRYARMHAKTSGGDGEMGGHGGLWGVMGVDGG